MKYKVFESIILLLKSHSKKSSDIYSLGIDLLEYDSELDEVISHLIGSYYGKDGKDWIEWWCYEKEWGTRSDITAHDKDNNIICETLEDLWKYVEENKTYDYDLPAKLTDEERLEIFKGIFNK